jgi:hypothetical protein
LEDRRQVIIKASVRWTWKASGNSWEEEFTAFLDFDDYAKVSNFRVRTESAAGTCVMRAVDKDLDRMLVDARVDHEDIAMDFEERWGERKDMWLVTEKALGAFVSASF